MFVFLLVSRNMQWSGCTVKYGGVIAVSRKKERLRNLVQPGSKPVDSLRGKLREEVNTS